MNSQKIIIPLPNGYKLVAEANSDSVYPYEIYVGIVGDDDVWYQDLAVVRNAYHYESTNPLPVHDEDKYQVLVYADEGTEDYTNSFSINQYHGGI